MKHLLCISLIILCFTEVNAQKYKGGSNSGASISAGIMGIGKNTWLFNKNVLDDKNSSQEMQASFGSSFGINLSAYFNENVGIGLDVLYATHSQKYNGITDDITKTPYLSKFKITSVDLPLYLRLSTNGGAFFELGTYFSFITASEYSNDAKLPLSLDAVTDAKANTSSFNIAPLLGFGIDINLTDYLILSPGLRFSYGVLDLKGVDGRGKPIENYPAPEKTNSLSGGLQVGIVYRIDV